MTARAIAGSPYVDEISARDPDHVVAGGRTWAVCGRNAVVAISELDAGAGLVERDVPDEHVLLLPGGTAVSVVHEGREPVTVSEPAVVVVPAGTSAVHVASATTVARVFTARCHEQMRWAVNHAAGPDPRTAPLPWTPRVPSGDRVRVHRLQDVPHEDGRLGRIFRTASLMVNWFPVHEGPRDTERLSPHSHDDFEQLSLTLAGRYVHHLRVPWTPRMSQWRDDEHVEVGSPSLTLIPPTVVHTTRAAGPGPHTLVDVFAPPREDFLAAGWVLNAGDYEQART